MGQQRFDTAKVHAGYVAADHNYAVSVPIYQTTAYELGSVERSDSMFAFDNMDALYTRLSNPTTDTLEARITAMHPGATGAIALASGMAAVTYSLLNVTAGKGRILATTRLYGGSVDSFEQVFEEYGVEADFVENPDDSDSFEKAVREDTKCIYIESITNPNATVLDIEGIAEVAHKHEIPLIVDNTIATPYLCNPFEFGADIVVYSATKGLSGHGNVIAGLVVENNRFHWKNGKFPQFSETPYFLEGLDGKKRNVTDIFPDTPFTGRIRAIYLNYLGAALSPFDSYLVMLGMETLSERIQKQVSNAKQVIKFLESRKEVLWVKHPEAIGNPYKKLADKYMPKGAGAILSFGLKGDEINRKKLLEATQVFSFQANIGDARSLIINPSRTTHIELKPEYQKAADIQDNTIRLSLGLEDPQDLIEDLKQALEKAFT